MVFAIVVVEMFFAIMVSVVIGASVVEEIPIGKTIVLVI